MPYDEPGRLRVLHQYNILDTPAEDRFDNIVRQAAARFETPIALFTLIDENRQWFKARIGLDIQETGRAASFCAHAVAINSPLVIENTFNSENFATNPLVVGPPGIGFYAGMPIRARRKVPLGALCIIDVVPRAFGWDDYRLLREFAEQIEEQLEARQLELGRSPGGTTH